ncbi:RNA polymerase II C-terminal domain phosphatase-like 4 [Apium graveolens]|uniref:RNA polymerase II C-terminal domain phosphatase-like 4 n=1 Tax=Apium graveolens TaxID=4045 RepID=UPI003D793455
MAAETISFNYLVKGLKMSVDQVERVRHMKLLNLQSRRKLCLVLDLDHTLLHTNFRHQPNTNIKDPPCHDDIFEWKATGVKYLTKLRPFVRSFLQEASQMFELYVYTMGSRDYASIVVRDFLDPQGIYFGDRIISREDCTVKGLKGLDVVPVHPSAVVILDDTEAVWKGFFRNLILVEKYDYFSQVGRLDESEDAGELSFALEVLTKLHSVYFESYDCFMECDVRDLIHTHWEEFMDDQGHQAVGTGTCAPDMVSGKRARVDDEYSSVTKKQRIC